MGDGGAQKKKDGSTRADDINHERWHSRGEEIGSRLIMGSSNTIAQHTTVLLAKIARRPHVDIDLGVKVCTSIAAFHSRSLAHHELDSIPSTSMRTKLICEQR